MRTIVSLDYVVVCISLTDALCVHAARLNYVNGFGPDAVKYGIQVLAPEFFGGPPDIVISGPNIGGGTLRFVTCPVW